jgi:hypothetical protein
VRDFGGDVVVAPGAFEEGDSGHILDATGFGWEEDSHPKKTEEENPGPTAPSKTRIDKGLR